MSEWKEYRRPGVTEMRPYVLGEDLSKTSVAIGQCPELDMGMIARNPRDHSDQWYVTRTYFVDNMELA